MATDKSLNHDSSDLHDEHDFHSNNQSNHMNQKNQSADKWEIPGDWRELKLRNIGKITSGTTPLRSNLDFHIGGTIPWVKTTDLNNSVILETQEKITEFALIETSLRIYPKETVLVAMYGGFNQIGRTGILGIEATINQALSAITVDKNEIDTTYLLNWLNAKVGFWKNLAGSSRKDPNITSKDVGDFPFIKPPLPEQKAIARVLSTADAAIHTTEKLIAQKELRKKWLMQNLLTGKMRLKGFGGEWKEVRFSDCLSRMANGITYDTEKRKGIPVTRIETISNGIINFNKIGFADNTENIEDYRLQKGDILYSHINSLAHIGKVAIYGDERPLYHGMNLLLLRCNKFTNTDFFFQWLVSENGRRKAISLAKPAVNQASISTTELKKICINLPVLEEQTAIAQVLQAADKEIGLLKVKAEKLREQKKGLMQQLLTGRKRLNLNLQD